MSVGKGFKLRSHYRKHAWSIRLRTITDHSVGVYQGLQWYVNNKTTAKEGTLCQSAHYLLVPQIYSSSKLASWWKTAGNGLGTLLLLSGASVELWLPPQYMPRSLQHKWKWQAWQERGSIILFCMMWTAYEFITLYDSTMFHEFKFMHSKKKERNSKEGVSNSEVYEVNRVWILYKLLETLNKRYRPFRKFTFVYRLLKTE